MKTIRELRMVLDFNPQEINSQISHFAKHAELDFDVFLPTLGINLQRDFVWDIEQKRELIWSIVLGRNIPRMSMINTIDDVYQVIDGKQRLTTMLDFYNNKFELIIDNTKFFFNELPIDYQRAIGGYFFTYVIVNEDCGNEITDKEKVNWFKFINFVGTPQDKAHLDKLELSKHN